MILSETLIPHNAVLLTLQLRSNVLLSNTCTCEECVFTHSRQLKPGDLEQKPMVQVINVTSAFSYNTILGRPEEVRIIASTSFWAETRARCKTQTECAANCRHSQRIAVGSAH